LVSEGYVGDLRRQRRTAHGHHIRRKARADGRNPYNQSLDKRGLTGSHRPLYSARFATPAFGLDAISPCGGIGRRARLKIEFRKECWFDSGQGHQKLLQAFAI
jgi:hypothetical protein